MKKIVALILVYMFICVLRRKKLRDGDVTLLFLLLYGTSQIILDSTAAADQIPKESRGRFLLHDGTLFQGYWFDEMQM